MPRAKSDDAKTSTELEDEIKEMRKAIAAKKKAAKLAKQKEDQAAEEARRYEEAQFNREFVARSKSITRDMFRDDQETAYELIERLLRNPVKATFSEATEEERRETLLRMGIPEDEIEDLD